MGTHQQLTTEQVEVLIFIGAMNKFYEDHPDELETDMEEIIDKDKMTKDSGEEICEILKRYEYIEEDTDKGTGYDLTPDGRQYIRLLEEYLEVKDKNPEMVHNQFSLINIEKIQFSLVDSFKLLGIDIEATEIIKLAKGISDSIKSIVKKFKKREQE